MSISKVKLTEKDKNTLHRANYLKDEFNTGIYGNYQHLAKLEKYGLLIRYGRTKGFNDIDGNEIGDRWIFRLTDKGKKAIINEY